MSTLYVSDLDGTLLRSDETTSEYTNHIINNLTDRGMIFSYATARSLITAKKVTEGIKANIPLIVYNGAFVMDHVTEDILIANYFDDSVNRLLDDLFRREVYPIVYSYIDGNEKFSFVPDLCTKGMKLFLDSRKGDIRTNRVQTMDELKKGDIFYITCIDAPEKLEPFYEKYKDVFHCVYQKDIYTKEQWLEIMPPNTSKSNAIRQLQNLLKCERVVVFGDGKNDIDMFELADEAYAVQNAHPDLKKYATAIIASNDDDGVAKWLAGNMAKGMNLKCGGNRKMRVTESCAECLYDKQIHLTEDKKYLEEIKSIIDNRGEDDCAPYLVYRFNQVYEKYFGQKASYKDIKKKYNDLVLSLEEAVRKRIEASKDPLAQALLYARAGNYIDFGAMNQVEEETFLSLLDSVKLQEQEATVIASFVEQCKNANSFLLIADNCGEIVLDKLFLEQLHKRFSVLSIDVMVRGGEVLNDATKEDAEYVGISNVARVISNGLPIAGTVYELLPDDAKEVMDRADVILAKGQGNYESLCKQGRHIFYSFLCKCELFTSRFRVPRLTGIFVEEWD